MDHGRLGGRSSLHPLHPLACGDLIRAPQQILDRMESSTPQGGGQHPGRLTLPPPEQATGVPISSPGLAAGSSIRASEHFTSQTDYPGAGDWQEELSKKIKALKNQYLPELSDLCNRIHMKLQHIDNHMPTQKLTEQYEKLKSFELMLERAMMFLQIDKSCIQPALKDKIPAFERQFVNILNSQKRKPVQTFEQSSVQTPSSNSCRIPVDSAAQSGYPVAGDFDESLDQMNRTLKNKYLAGLSDLYEISMQLRVDSHMPTQKATCQYEEMNSFKLMLERSLHSLQIGKSNVHPALEESIPIFKRQIINILNSEEWKSERVLRQSAGQAPSTRSGRESSLERSNTKRVRPC